FRRRRCLVVADGFFEWQREGGRKQPYYIRLQDDQPFALAGLWERWHREELTIESCTIITTTANELVRPLHDRMPVILPKKYWEAWLDPAVEDVEPLEKLLAPFPSEQMVSYPVDAQVNSPRVDTPQCIASAVPQKVQRTLFD